MFLKKGLFTLICKIFINVSLSFAQTESDSLLQVLENYPQEDTTKAMLLLDLGNSLRRTSPEKAEYYSKQGLELSEKLNFKLGIARGYVISTNALLVKGDLENGLKQAQLTLQKCKEAEFLQGEGHAYKFMGMVYMHQKNLEEARKYFEQALATYRRLNKEPLIGHQLIDIGMLCYQKEAYDSALLYLNEAKKMDFGHTRLMTLAAINNNIGLIHKANGNLDEAIDIYHESLKIRREVKDQMGEIISLENLGNAYCEKENYTLAEKYLLEALQLADELHLIIDRVYLNKDLVELEKSRGNYEKALTYYENYSIFNDSLLNETKNKQITEWQTQYETEKKEKEIASLQLDNQSKSFWQKIFGIGLFLVALLAISIFLFFRYRNKVNRKLLQAEQNQTRQLQEVDRMKSRFFTNISHEFRTPLTLILGPLDALQLEVQGDTAKKQLQVIQRSAQRLLKLINQMLNLSKLEAGKLELKASPQNIVPYLRGLVFSFHSLAEKKKILLNFESTEDEILVFLDAEKIEQIITNLLSNAFKFTKELGKISVSLQRMNWQEKPSLQIMVKDTGNGISQDQLPYIFDRFFQADASDTKEHEGTGIGLALAKELALLHKGDIAVESEKGKGSTFYLYLPLGKAHLNEDEVMIIPHEMITEPEPVPTNTREVIVQNSPSLNSETEEKPLLLVVEDHPDLQDYIYGILSSEYQIIQAENGKNGLEKAQTYIPNLIISDVMMPKMNGITLCKHLKNDIRTSHIPVVLLTAKTTEEDKLTGLESQADDYLTKPFNTRELRIRIKNLITIREKMQEKFRGSVIVKPKEIEVSSMEQVFLEKLMQLLEENLSDEGFGVEQLSDEIGMSRVHLHRKLQALTNHSPSQFIRRFRLQRAMDLLQKNAATIAEVAYTVGFSSPTYFTKCFVEQYGYPPKEVKAHQTLT